MEPYSLVACIMLAVFAVTLLYPWHPRLPAAGYLVHLPLTLVPLFCLHETLMPKTMNIRLDLLLWFWVAVVSATIYAVRLIVFAAMKRRVGRDAGVGKRSESVM